MRLKIDQGHLKVPRKVVPSRGARFAKRQVFSRGELGEDVDDDDEADGDGEDDGHDDDGLQNTKFSLELSWGRSSSHTSDTNMDRGIFFFLLVPNNFSTNKETAVIRSLVVSLMVLKLGGTSEKISDNSLLYFLRVGCPEQS